MIRNLVVEKIVASSLRELVDVLEIKPESAVKLLSGGENLNHDFEINPDDFLQAAEDDFERQGEAALINAISNAKRAIHSQIDQALQCLGYKPKRWDIRRKLSVLGDLGFIAPRILRRVSRARNVLEHEYRSPPRAVVEESLDLAALFLDATCRHLDSFDSDFSVGNLDEQVDMFHCRRELNFMFDDTQKHFTVWAREDVPPESEWTFVPGEGSGNSDLKITRPRLVGKTTVNVDSIHFAPIVRLAIAGNRPTRIEEAIYRFFASLGIKPS